MDKIVAHEDVSFADPNHWLKYRNCMHIITGRISDLVETVNLDNLFVLDVIKRKPCRVELVRIAHTPRVKLPTLQTNQDLLAFGEYFTRSKVRRPRPRTHRRPQNASSNVDYNESTECRDADIRIKLKKTKTTPPADGPTASRVQAQS